MSQVLVIPVSELYGSRRPWTCWLVVGLLSSQTKGCLDGVARLPTASNAWIGPRMPLSGGLLRSFWCFSTLLSG